MTVQRGSLGIASLTSAAKPARIERNELRVMVLGLDQHGVQPGGIDPTDREPPAAVGERVLAAVGIAIGAVERRTGARTGADDREQRTLERFVVAAGDGAVRRNSRRRELGSSAGRQGHAQRQATENHVAPYHERILESSRHGPRNVPSRPVERPAASALALDSDYRIVPGAPQRFVQRRRFDGRDTIADGLGRDSQLLAGSIVAGRAGLEQHQQPAVFVYPAAKHSAPRIEVLIVPRKPEAEYFFELGS